MSMHQHVADLEETLRQDQDRCAKAIKSKNKAVKERDRAKADIEGFESLLGRVEEMRQNEEGLLRKVNAELYKNLRNVKSFIMI